MLGVSAVDTGWRGTQSVIVYPFKFKKAFFIITDFQNTS